MDHSTAKQATDLYAKLRSIDGLLEHCYHRHRQIIKVGVWASVASGNYAVEVEIPTKSPFAPIVQAAVEGQLLRDRERAAEELERLGFEAPEIPDFGP